MTRIPRRSMADFSPAAVQFCEQVQLGNTDLSRGFSSSRRASHTVRRAALLLLQVLVAGGTRIMGHFQSALGTHKPLRGLRRRATDRLRLPSGARFFSLCLQVLLQRYGTVMGTVPGAVEQGDRAVARCVQQRSPGVRLAVQFDKVASA